METIRPLIGSVDAPDHRQPWRTGGLWQRTINLYVEGGALLTLHHQGQGVSPGGWVLRHRDFIRLHAALRAGALPLARDNGIQVDSLLLSPPRRRCSLRPCYQPNGAYLPATLMNRPEETGLFGPLSQAIHLPQHPELRQLRHCFASALTGNAIDWRLWLGKGPGLTPSLDDMLIGMMLAAWCAGQMSCYGGRTFFRASGDLHAVTTQVSVNYLRYASEGRFASPLMHFAHALQRRRRIEPAIEALLAMGHTSGADTLLGFWLAQHII
ncbi:DUF2877 domain-containing protein [Klebsiella spallanzanii]|uniref:DUF2877 domain-containing protein n=1 Tax=Klebsiella spallanzanii TaxID=2587528 RepID=UPI001157902A|nr:DUF2877 domain-containing protein [Klebsiella spallanzanii]VUS83112.1 hypothetical protein SB6419_04524 [Klebsiella spallanzanii]